MFADKKFVLHLIPSGILQDKARCLLGNGMVIDPGAFIEELEQLQGMGIDPTGRLFISDSAHLILPHHKLIDRAREDRLKANKIGTTVRGIGPAYEDKVGRQGFRFIDLEDTPEFKAKISQVTTDKNNYLKHVLGYEGPLLDGDQVFKDLMADYDKIAPYITNTQALVHEAAAQGEHILLEGAQGTFLDIDHGTFPFVTSSNTTSGGACTGSGLAPGKIDQVLGVVKAYTTRVGSGPFPTELFDETGAFLSKEGNEFGATTGRPRRCGWFDVCMLRDSVQVNGMTGLAITKLDVLDKLENINLCIGYEDEKGNRIDRIPHKGSSQEKIKPIYETMPGWQSSTQGVTEYDALPEKAKSYLTRIADLLGVPIAMVSTGPKREETVILSHPFI